MAKPYAEAWREILSCPAGEVALFLEDPGERARQLRQTSPFAGFLDARTRWVVWRRARRGAGAPCNRAQLEHVIQAERPSPETPRSS